MRPSDGVEPGDRATRHLPHVATITVCGIKEIADCRPPPSHVLSIFDPGQARPDVPIPLPPGRWDVLEFHDIIGPAPGWVVPTEDHMETILEFGRSFAQARSGSCDVLIHCNMGLSRSTASLAAMLAQSDPAMDGDGIFELVSRIRPQAWPNSLMIRHADNLLGRGGKLLMGLGEFYRKQLIRFPAYQAHLCQIGRGQEVEMAAQAQIS